MLVPSIFKCLQIENRLSIFKVHSNLPFHFENGTFFRERVPFHFHKMERFFRERVPFHFHKMERSIFRHFLKWSCQFAFHFQIGTSILVWGYTCDLPLGQSENSYIFFVSRLAVI